MSEPDPEPTSLDDAGTVQTLLFVGWIPPAVTALIGGVVLGVASGSFQTVLVVGIGGTIVGYVVSLTILFTVGRHLERRRATTRTADAFVKITVAVGVLAAIAVAVLASIAIPLAILATVVAVAIPVLAIVYYAATDRRLPEAPVDTADRGYVTQSEFGEDWPFSVSAGTLVCYPSGDGRQFVTFDIGDGIEYGINGQARDFGFPDIDEAVLPSYPDLSGLGPIIAKGLELCE